MILQVILAIIFMISIIILNGYSIDILTDESMVLKLSIDAFMYSLPFSIICTFLAFWLITALRGKNFLKMLNLNRIKMSTFLLCIGFSICFYPLIAVIADNLTKIFPSFNEIQDTFNEMFNGSLLFSIIYVCIMGPIMEEIITRGLIFYEFKESTNSLIAIILQAIFFGIMHLNMVQGIYAFILGITYGIFREKFNSLIITIVCHIAHNSFSMALGYLPDKITNNDFILPIAFVFTCLFLIIFSILLYIDWKKHYKLID